jgi:hypothetical protein
MERIKHPAGCVVLLPPFLWGQVAHPDGGLPTKDCPSSVGIRAAVVMMQNVNRRRIGCTIRQQVAVVMERAALFQAAR